MSEKDLTKYYEVLNHLESIKEERIQKLQDFYRNTFQLINKELFSGVLHDIEINVEDYFFFSGSSSAQYRMHPDGRTEIAVSYESFENMIHDWTTDYFEESEVIPTEQELEEEMKAVVVGTLIHEMIHQYGNENNIQDSVIEDGVDIHTSVFKNLAEEKGLTVLEDYNGFSNTHIRTDHPLLQKIDFRLPDFTSWTPEEIIDEYLFE